MSNGATTLLVIYIVVNFFGAAIMAFTSVDGANPSFVNPIVIYNNVRVNWFGAVLLSVISNVLLPSLAIPYWIYKLCTIGRK